MATAPRRIGVLTGGGDCPGLNAVLRAVTKDALYNGIEVIGIEDGFLGLIENRLRPLGYEDVSNILTAGGTILGSSNKADPARFATGKKADGTPLFEDVTERCMTHAQGAGIEALVVIGGDGTMTCAQPFADRGLPCIGVPKTIDNDIYGTELTFGFLTASHIATEALDRVHSTAASHKRAIVVEVMGRNAGWIALQSGIASGSDVILLPEIPFSMDHVCDVVTSRRDSGKRFTIVCVAEGASMIGGEQIVARRDPTSPEPVRLGGIAQHVAELIEDRTGVESRHVVLGHVQRGGTPVPTDRVLGTLFGDQAIELLKNGHQNRMVAIQAGAPTHIDITEPADKQRRVPLDHPLIAAARSVYTSFGDQSLG
jgi:ATP-dependent phosphofructokinase / diphosphate-dependent phosphofructokinase